MAQAWTILNPRLLKHVNVTSDAYILSDVLTKEEFAVLKSNGNISGQNYFPWFGTLVMIEEFQEIYYFNGLRAYVMPNELDLAIHKVDELVAQGYEEDEVLFDFYPGILATLHGEAGMLGDGIDEEQKQEISLYQLTYEVVDKYVVAEYLCSQQD